MGFNINTKKNRISLGGNNYQRLRSIEDLTTSIDKSKRYSTSSDIRMPTHSTFNKRFSEQSFSSLSNVSVAETYCSTTTSNTEETPDINEIYACYQPEYEINYDESSKKPKKHRKRKALSKIFQSFSLNDQLQQSMQCPDWEYHCNKQNNHY
ncbi:hypothetical protein H8356DRAFT_98414 [Neocallimastix lanati (nom. inval.)]|uniref:Uncharacterized protein n=1 Tax=Neocallimastix californiae TaxID=1754190 RepID=A0A1Y2EG89_9FUNG|nr:hypothetical protein H8356DRAFT_98414 [Neocallimastix sp. JGI-2020a]ORY70589.1 hypothetical protein LY90DRAFT_504159 [Neocallimastix californiae]|eukprot:ORY70589.1 hypothetical protein LY90DRAFT_504159 [Neocallimastix californiae]